jgi:hypothetical protein
LSIQLQCACWIAKDCEFGEARDFALKGDQVLLALVPGNNLFIGRQDMPAFPLLARPSMRSLSS